SPDEDTSVLAAGTRVFNVLLELSKKESSHFVPGMTATVEFITQRLPQAVYVPNDCVFEEGEYHVAYVRKGKQFVATRVTPGAENARLVQIKKGLQPGQQISRQRPMAPEESG